MRLDIKLVNQETFYCLEKVFATVGSYFGRGYEMIFLNQIRHYQSDSTGTLIKTIHNSRLFNREHMYRLFEEYHGIKTIIQSFDTVDELLKFIAEELAESRPVAVTFDETCQPWMAEQDKENILTFYQGKKPYLGELLINGIEDDNLWCIDVHYSQRQEKIPLNIFKQGVALNYIISFRKIESNAFVKNNFQNSVLMFDDAKLQFTRFKNVVRELVREDNTENVFVQLMLFINEIHNCIYLKSDQVQEEKALFTHLKGSLNKLYRTRYLFSLSLHYMVKLTENMQLEKLYYKYNEMVSYWYISYLLAVRANMKKEYRKDIVEEIVDKLKYACNQEKYLLSEILNIDFECSQQSDHDVEQIKGKNVCEKRKNYYVDLNAYFNNDSYLRMFESKEDAIDIYSFKELKYGKFAFCVSNHISNEEPDNISCNGQRIDVVPISGSVLQILGFGEEGNFTGIGQIIYENGMKTDFALEFSRYIRKTTYDIRYNQNTLVWEGQMRNCSENERGKLLASLYANEYQLLEGVKVCSIVMPNIPNLHVLAMSIQ